MRFNVYGKPSREWPDELPYPPEELIELIADAMVDFGPDRHCDGADQIAALVLDWASGNVSQRAFALLGEACSALEATDELDNHAGLISRIKDELAEVRTPPPPPSERSGDGKEQ